MDVGVLRCTSKWRPQGKKARKWEIWPTIRFYHRNCPFYVLTREEDLACNPDPDEPFSLPTSPPFACNTPMKPLKKWEDLTIQDNFLFQKVMRDDGLCRRLLERLLGITISKIDFPHTGKSFDTDFKAKSVRLDVYVEDDSIRVFDIEMQSKAKPDDELPLRSRYYQAMIDQSILEKGNHTISSVIHT